jgi:cytochrome c
LLLKGFFMRRVLVVLALSSAVSMPALANKDLATKSACMACHAVDKKILGPAYQDIAKKYEGKKDALKTVMANIKSGGAGKWGAIPMPAQAALSEADTKTLATWILAGAK